MMNDNKIKNAFESMNENELEELLSGFRAESLDELTKKRIAKSAFVKAGSPARERAARPRISRRAMIAIAACLALVIALGAGSFAYAAEAKEYKAALAYFEENGMSTEGLSRSEIKEVYRNFRISASEEGPNGEKKEHETSIGGVSFPADAAAPADDDEFVHADSRWSRIRNGHRERIGGSRDEDGVITLIKYLDDAPLWSCTVEPQKLSFITAFLIDDGTVILGAIPNDETEPSIKAAMLISDDGTEMWFREIGEGREVRAVGAPDGSVAFFSLVNEDPYENNGILRVTRIAQNGEVLCAADNFTGMPVVVGEVYCFGEGFIITGFDAIGAEQRLYMIGADGHINANADYALDGWECTVCGVKEYGGKVYVSVNAAAEEFIDTAGSDMDPATTDEEALEFTINSTKALLLVCDSAGGEPRIFYEAEGSMGIDLDVNEKGELEWTVWSTCAAKVEPNMPAEDDECYGIKATFRVYKYRFAEDGSFIERFDTGMVTDGSVEL